jgi:hypothetical protein
MSNHITTLVQRTTLRIVADAGFLAPAWCVRSKFTIYHSKLPKTWPTNFTDTMAEVAQMSPEAAMAAYRAGYLGRHHGINMVTT